MTKESKALRIFGNIFYFLVIFTVIAGISYVSYFIGRTSLKTECEPELEIMKIAKMNSENSEYNRTGYNCLNFSNDLVDLYEEAGYEAEVVVGWVAKEKYCDVDDNTTSSIPVNSMIEAECIGAHAWVEVKVPIEAVTGEVIRE